MKVPPAGSVAKWVEMVRRFEEGGWLRDPQGDIRSPHGSDLRRVRDHICESLCWRGRCHRARRCKHRMPLAVREFMPESVYISEITHDSPLYFGPLHPGKMQLLREILGPPYDEASLST